MYVKSMLIAGVVLSALSATSADTLELRNGTVLKDCYLRDEGVRLLVWEKFEDVGKPPRIVPQSQVKAFKVRRDPKIWDEHPSLPDLSVTYIEMNPKLVGLHERIDYTDKTNRPILRGFPAYVDLGDKAVTEPEKAAAKLKLKYAPGEDITLTAHVRNVGFAAARPFEYVWLIDGREVSRGKCDKSLGEMQEAFFAIKWKWQDGFHHVTFRVKSAQPEISQINDEVTDPLWGWGMVYVVHNGRVAKWHQVRSAYGTFSFEDYYRWHIDIMNTLFAESRFPAAPEGIKARVRLDRIVYADDVEKAVKGLFAADGMRYDQGGWNWLGDDDKKKDWQLPSFEWRTGTEWSMPHELGHQLGLVDDYWIDYDPRVVQKAGKFVHVMPDNGDLIGHFQRHPIAMMHWHGPHIYNEIDAAYLNYTMGKPRGYFGDHYFALPKENYIRILDVNGNGVPDAKVEIYQRGAQVDEKAAPGTDHGVRYYQLIEDGDFDKPISKLPVIVGPSDRDGTMRLPNRPVQEVRTLNGFSRTPNPFGNMNVVGERCLMMVKVTKYERPCYYFLELHDFNVAWFRGHKDSFTVTLKTPYGGEDSPPPPANVKVTQVDKEHVKVTWEAPKTKREGNYLDRAIAYRIYRRISSDGLNDRPWFPVATITASTFEATVDLKQTFQEDVYWYTNSNRFAVTAVGECSVESELAEVVLPESH